MSSTESRVKNRRQFGKLALMWLSILYVVFLYLPVIFLPVFSFNDSKFIAFPLSGFTFRWYAEMMADEGLINSLMNSLKVGAVASLSSTVLGLLAARAITRYAIPGKELAVGFIMLPLFLPEIVLGISLLILWLTLDLPLSLASIVLGHILICIPFALAMLISRFDGFDRSLEEASLDLGEGPWMTFWRVTFPLVLPGVVASLLLTFIVSFDDFLIAFFLSGTEPTLPVFMWSELRFPSRFPRLLALGALILIVSAVLVVLAEMLRQRGVSEGGKATQVGIT